MEETLARDLSATPCIIQQTPVLSITCFLFPLDKNFVTVFILLSNWSYLCLFPRPVIASLFVLGTYMLSCIFTFNFDPITNLLVCLFGLFLALNNLYNYLLNFYFRTYQSSTVGYLPNVRETQLLNQRNQVKIKIN